LNQKFSECVEQKKTGHKYNGGGAENKKLSYRSGTARRESLPKIAEMDVVMTN